MSKRPPYADYAEKELTESTKLFIDWMEENVGYSPDARTIQLVRSLNGAFQKSEINQARLRKNAEARAQTEQEKLERRKAREEKAQAASARKAPEKKAPVKKAPAAKTTSATKKAPAPRRRRRKAPAPETAGATN